MTDLEKASINAFEDQFIAVLTGCFLDFSQNVYRKIQSIGLARLYMDDQEFALENACKSAFVVEHDVDCFNIIMVISPQAAMEVAKYFEETYIGRRLPDLTRRIPPFPIRFWRCIRGC